LVGHGVGLRNSLAFAYGKSLVLVGVRLKRRLEKQVARHGLQRGQHRRAADASPGQVADEGAALAPVAVRVVGGLNGMEK
jgi:hypothetical protein